MTDTAKPGEFERFANVSKEHVKEYLDSQKMPYTEEEGVMVKTPAKGGHHAKSAHGMTFIECVQQVFETYGR